MAEAKFDTKTVHMSLSVRDALNRQAQVALLVPRLIWRWLFDNDPAGLGAAAASEAFWGEGFPREFVRAWRSEIARVELAQGVPIFAETECRRREFTDETAAPVERPLCGDWSEVDESVLLAWGRLDHVYGVGHRRRRQTGRLIRYGPLAESIGWAP